MKKLTLLLICTFVLIISCSKENQNNNSEKTDEKIILHCYIGGTMRPAMEEIIKIYEAENPVDIFIDYAGSGELLIRMEKSRQGDLYIAHDPFMDSAKKRKLAIAGKRAAIITPVITVQKGNPHNIKDLNDLVEKDITVLLPSREYSTTGHLVDYMYAKLGKLEQLEENVLSRLRCPCDAANSLTLNTADAAIVWDAVAFLRRDKLDTIPIPTNQLPQRGVDVVTTATFGKVDMGVTYVNAMVLKYSQHRKEAIDFMEFTASDRMKEIWQKHGFTTE